MAHSRIPEVALGFGSDHLFSKGTVVPAGHGMPIWSVGLCWMSIGLWEIAATAFRRLDDFQKTHAVVCWLFAALVFVLIGRLTWL